MRPFLSPPVVSTFVCALLTAFASLSAAFDVNPSLLPDFAAGPGRDLSSEALSATDLERAERPLHEFSRASDSRWSVLDWSPASLTPRLAVGTGVELGIAVRDQEAAERVARQFVSDHSELFRTTPDRLRLFRAHAGLGKWSLIFQEEIDGMVVLGSKVVLLVTEGGRLAAFGASTFPMIDAVQAPSLDRAAALDAARAHLSGLGLDCSPSALRRTDVEGPFVLPVLRGDGLPSPGSAGVVGRAVFRVVLVARSHEFGYAITVDALDGTVLERQNILRPLDFVGQVRGDVEEPGYCDGISDKAMGRFFVSIDGVGTTTTDLDGNFTLPYAGNDPRAITAEMKGLVCDVNNVDGAQAAFSGTITPGVPFTLHWNDAQSRADERDTYYHVDVTHALLQSIDPAWHDLDFPLPANVNLQQGCNAFWDGESINMFHEQGGCGNTGRIGDVVSHEYAHGITDFMYGPDDPPSDLHEGNSDVCGTFRNNNSIVGPGFYLADCVNGIRDLDNDLRWPDDLQGEGHFDGQILGGFHWDTRERLITSLGPTEGPIKALEIWHFARILGLPYSQPEQVWWSFLADDDNGNLDDGTPHYDAICPSAIHHGFTCPERFADVVIHHAAMEYGVSIDGSPIPIRASIYSLDAALNPDSVYVAWRLSGTNTFQHVSFVSLGGDNWEALIPGQQVGKGVDYYIHAEDVLGNELKRPFGEAMFYAFQVVSAYDPFEENDGGWTVGAAGDNATTGVWERVDPVGTTLAGRALQPGDDTTPDPGALCWVTGQYNGGQPYQSDADGTTTLLSPIYDLSGMTWAYVRYARWFQTLSEAAGALNIAVSYNGGTSWTPIEHVSGMQTPAAWTVTSKDITPQLGQLGLTRFRVRMLGLPLPSVDEGAFDDFVLLADDQGSPAAVSENGASAELALRMVSENPARGLLALEYRLDTTQAMSLALHSIDGRVVRTLLRGQMNAGSHRIEWDGRDDAGRWVASGVYFARLRGAFGEVTRRILIAR